MSSHPPLCGDNFRTGSLHTQGKFLIFPFVQDSGLKPRFISQHSSLSLKSGFFFLKFLPPNSRKKCYYRGFLPTLSESLPLETKWEALAISLITTREIDGSVFQPACIVSSFPIYFKNTFRGLQ